MIRNLYRLNTLVGRDPRVTIFSRDAPTTGFERLSHLGGFRRLPGFWTIEWRFFFDVGELGEDEERNHSRLIDSHLAFELSQLPDNVATGIIALAQRNLMRGSAMGLPSGQDVAGLLGAEPLSAEELDVGGRAAPLWFYILKEAELCAGGRRLGPVGGTIVAETFVGMLQGDRRGGEDAEGGVERRAVPARAGAADLAQRGREHRRAGRAARAQRRQLLGRQPARLAAHEHGQLARSPVGGRGALLGGGRRLPPRPRPVLRAPRPPRRPPP